MDFPDLDCWKLLQGKIEDEISCLEYDKLWEASTSFVNMFGFWMQSQGKLASIPLRSGQTIASSAQPHYKSNKKLTIAGWRIINHLSRYSVATNMWQSHVRMVDVTRNHQKPGPIGLHGSCASRTIRLRTSSWGTGGGFSRCNICRVNRIDMFFFLGWSWKKSRIFLVYFWYL